MGQYRLLIRSVFQLGMAVIIATASGQQPIAAQPAVKTGHVCRFRLNRVRSMEAVSQETHVLPRAVRTFYRSQIPARVLLCFSQHLPRRPQSLSFRVAPSRLCCHYHPYRHPQCRLPHPRHQRLNALVQSSLLLTRTTIRCASWESAEVVVCLTAVRYWSRMG